MKRWDDNKKLLTKFTQIIRQICNMDVHQLREERIIFPQLAEHGCDDMLQSTCAEHDRLHKSRVELKILTDSLGKMALDQWKDRLDEVVQYFVPAVREHIYKEENLLYPNALKLIQDQHVWQSMKAACDELGLGCF